MQDSADNVVVETFDECELTVIEAGQSLETPSVTVRAIERDVRIAKVAGQSGNIRGRALVAGSPTNNSWHLYVVECRDLKGWSEISLWLSGTYETVVYGFDDRDLPFEPHNFAQMLELWPFIVEPATRKFTLRPRSGSRLHALMIETMDSTLDFMELHY